MSGMRAESAVIFAIAAAVLGGIAVVNTAFCSVMVSGFTSKKKAYFRKKHDHVNTYLNKMELFFLKCKEDKVISTEELEGFQKFQQAHYL